MKTKQPSLVEVDEGMWGGEGRRKMGAGTLQGPIHRNDYIQRQELPRPGATSGEVGVNNQLTAPLARTNRSEPPPLPAQHQLPYQLTQRKQIYLHNVWDSRWKRRTIPKRYRQVNEDFDLGILRYNLEVFCLVRFFFFFHLVLYVIRNQKHFNNYN